MWFSSCSCSFFCRRNVSSSADKRLISSTFDRRHSSKSTSIRCMLSTRSDLGLGGEIAVTLLVYLPDMSALLSSLDWSTSNQCKSRPVLCACGVIWTSAIILPARRPPTRTLRTSGCSARLMSDATSSLKASMSTTSFKSKFSVTDINIGSPRMAPAVCSSGIPLIDTSFKF